MDWEIFYTKPHYIQIGLLREWIGARKKKPLVGKDKTPIWVHFIRRKMWAALEEILQYENIDINWRDKQGRNFLHYCVYHNAPHRHAITGLSLMDKNWMQEDIFHTTPLEAFPTPHLGQAMAWRWWRENGNIHEKQKLFYKLAQEALAGGHDDIARIWNFWSTKIPSALEKECIFDNIPMQDNEDIS